MPCRIIELVKISCQDTIQTHMKSVSLSAAAPTMEDVARVAGVTPMTVSRAFNQPKLVSSKTRAAIQAAADQLAYVPNRGAGTLRSQTSKMLGLLIPSLSDITYHRIFSGLVQAVDASGYQVVVAETRYSNDRELSTLKQILGWRPAGFVLTGADHSEMAIKLLERARIPVCSVMQLGSKHKPFSTVGFSNAAAMRELTRHLLHSGRRRLVFVRAQGLNHQRHVQRLEAVRSAVARVVGAQIQVLDLDRQAPFTLQDGAHAVDVALRNDPLTDALMFSNDLPAAGAVLSCRRLGIDVPNRLSITGFGDLDIATMIDPQLTTVRLPVADMGRRAGEFLMRSIEFGESRIEHQDVSYELQVRESA